MSHHATHDLWRRLKEEPGDAARLHALQHELVSQRAFPVLLRVLDWWASQEAGPPGAAAILHAAAEQCLLHGAEEEAIELLARALELDPTRVDVVRRLYVLLHSKEDFARLESVLGAHAIALRTASAPPVFQAAVHEQLGALRAERLGNIDGAITAYRNAVVARPDPTLYTRLAELHRKRATSRGNGVGAQVALHEAASCHLRAAELLDGAGRQEAIEAALDCNPSHLEAMRMLEQLVDAAGGDDSRLVGRWTAFVAASSDGPEVAERRPRLARAHQRAGRRDEAIACLLPLVEQGYDSARRIVDHLRGGLAVPPPVAGPASFATLELETQDTVAQSWPSRPIAVGDDEIGLGDGTVPDGAALLPGMERALFAVPSIDTVAARPAALRAPAVIPVPVEDEFADEVTIVQRRPQAADPIIAVPPVAPPRAAPPPPRPHVPAPASSGPSAAVPRRSGRFAVTKRFGAPDLERLQDAEQAPSFAVPANGRSAPAAPASEPPRAPIAAKAAKVDAPVTRSSEPSASLRQAFGASSSPPAPWDEEVPSVPPVPAVDWPPVTAPGTPAARPSFPPEARFEPPPEDVEPLLEFLVKEELKDEASVPGRRAPARALRVAYVWNGAMQWEELLPTPRPVTLGDHPNDTFPMPDGASAGRSLTLVERGRDGRFALRLAPELGGCIWADGVRRDLSAFGPPGSSYELGPSDYGYVTLGPVAIVFQRVRGVRRAPRFEAAFFAPLACILLVAALAGGFLYLAYRQHGLDPPRPDPLRLRPEVVARFLPPPPPEPPPPPPEAPRPPSQEKARQRPEAPPPPVETPRLPQFVRRRIDASRTDPSTDRLVDALRSRIAPPIARAVENVNAAPGERAGASLGIAGIAGQLSGVQGPSLAVGGTTDIGTVGGPQATEGVERLRAREGPVRGRVRAVSALGRVSGSLSAAEVAAVVSRATGRMQRCYERGLIRNPSLSGRVALRWTIGPSGRVGGVSTTSNTLGDGEVASCIAGVVRGLRFPSPRGGPVTVSYPFMFQRTP